MRSVTTYTPAVVHGPSPQKALSPTRIVAIRVRPSSGPPCSSSRRGRESEDEALMYSFLVGVPLLVPVMICLPSGRRRNRRTTCGGWPSPWLLSNFYVSRGFFWSVRLPFGRDLAASLGLRLCWGGGRCWGRGGPADGGV